MSKLETSTVQRDPANRIRAAAVSFVANDWMTALSQMNSDLMLPSRFQPDFQNACLRIPLQYADMSNRKFSDRRSTSGIHAKGGVFRKVRFDREYIRRYSPFNRSDILAAGAVILELILKVLFRLNRLRENEQTRRFPVQSMHDEDSLGRSFAVGVCPKRSVEGVQFLFIGGDGQKAGGFIGNDNSIVFEHDTNF
jgi:hypothetical protein